MPEFTEKDQQTIDSLVSGVNFLSSSLGNAKQEIKKQKERIEALLKRIADLEGRTIEAGDGIDVDDYGSSIIISADQNDAINYEDEIYDFDPRFDGDDVYRTAGHRCIMGFHDGWELLPENSTPVTGNGTYWMKWVYTTEAAPGSFTEGYGTPPAQDATCTVALLWTVTDGVVKYHERGAKRFFDWDVC